MKQLLPDCLRFTKHLAGIAPAVWRSSASDAAVVAQQRRPHVSGALEISGKNPRAMTDICFNLQQVIGIAVEYPGMEAHHLHQPDCALVAHRLRLQPRVFCDEHAGQQTRWYLELTSLLHDGARYAVGDFRLGPPPEYLRQW